VPGIVEDGRIPRQVILAAVSAVGVFGGNPEGRCGREEAAQ